jgi:hypothetical protein
MYPQGNPGNSLNHHPFFKRSGCNRSFFLSPGVKCPVHFAQIVPVKVEVNLRGGDGLVPQHLLNRPQVSPAFDQVRCK